MPGTGQDIRITKTHMALSKALMELLEKKNFKNITVNDICQDAMVSRSTFYLHFEDKYQLMFYCLQTERQRMDAAAKSMGLRDFLHMVLTFVYSRKDVFRVYLQEQVDVELIGMLKRFFHEYFSDVLAECERRGVKLAGPIPLLSAYYSNGLSGMIVWWISEKFSVSIEDMAACQYNLLSDLLPNVKAD